MDAEKAIRTRRTHKAFGPAPVAPETLRELFELASWAPNHHLTNPWRFRVLGQRTRGALMALADARRGHGAAERRRPPGPRGSARDGGRRLHRAARGARARPRRLLAHRAA